VEILKNPNNPILMSKHLDFRAYGIDIIFEDEALVKIAERAAEEKTGARGLVSVIEKILIPFEKKLPSTGITKFLVTPEIVDDPEAGLKVILDDPDNETINRRFEKAEEKAFSDLKKYISGKAGEFNKISGIEISGRRIDLIAELYMRSLSDINTAFEVFVDMYNQIKAEENSLHEKLNVNISFDDSAADEIIHQAIETDQEAGTLAFQAAKRLEYGLNLVKERSGVDSFVINAEAITDMENFINNLIKNYYRQESWSGMPDAQDNE
jgi:ATP-dependent protease Clp ATPase subunit